MFVVRPVEYTILTHNLGVGFDDQDANGVPDPDPPRWDEGTTYIAGTSVSSPVGGLNNIYIALANSKDNLKQNPDTAFTNRTGGFVAELDEPFWRVRRKQNEFTFNDTRPTITTGRNNSIVLTIATTEAINTIGFIGLNATEVSYSFVSNNTVFTESVSLSDIDTVSTYEEYLRSPGTFDTTFLFRNIAGVVHTADNPITITISNPSDVASVGQIVMGFDTRFGVVDASTVTVSSFTQSTVSEDAFGVTQIVARASAKSMDFTSVIERNRIGAAQLVLERFLSTPAIYYVSEDNSFGSIVYGILTSADYNFFMETQNHGRIVASVRGII